ncbi:hypothetical protein BDB01DRAFT_719898 [Pilobolus umbonatus]|nr:hypothetical protein BDB01DRAFT_719898 [Pilobolus umbonatus]
MSSVRPASPSTGYSIIDVRATSHKILKTANVKRPASPPESSESSEDAFNQSDLADIILDSLSQPENAKSIPTYVLYDKHGLQLFDEITYLDDEYYLTSAETDILMRKSDEFVSRMKDNSVLFELGAGSLRKTQVILDAIERKKVRATYYAIDLDQHELEKSLSSLKRYTYVALNGVLGTYDQGIYWISKCFTSRDIQKNFLWLGSSVGNQTRGESALFLHRLQRMCMEPGDYMVIGFDKRNDPTKIGLAYNDSKGITRDFILNGLDHVNRILGKSNFIDRKDFAYDSRYQEEKGRHVAHYRALKDLKINHKTSRKSYAITIRKNELIHVEHSYKYSSEEVNHILSAANLSTVEDWLDSKDLYRLVVAEIPPFSFKHNVKDVQMSLFGSNGTQEAIACDICNQKDRGWSADKLDKVHNFSDVSFKESLPSVREWEELWKSWDMVTQHMMDNNTMLFERPIALRHPFIFYLGHIPAFLDIQLSRHSVDEVLGITGLTHPAKYADIFERGIDPDMDDPTKCHPHSEVPADNNDWPSLNSILSYKSNIRNRLRNLLSYWEATESSPQLVRSITKRHARIVWMCFEHEAMHLETILYMLIQSPRTLSPKGVSVPGWKLALDKKQPLPKLLPLSSARKLKVFTGLVSLGHYDHEKMDLSAKYKHDVEFGWDNEHPVRQVAVRAFEIDSRPITNGEYYTYMKERNISNIPASWSVENGITYIRTVFGFCPLEFAQHWPVQVSFEEANAYAKSKNCRLPTEPELIRFRDCVKTQTKEQIKTPNIGFHNWTPTDVNNKEVYVMGDNWEWTDTIFDAHTGFEKSDIYPGYSSDFFDGKHRVVLGGSWATHPRIAERRSFRNYYQSKYPYVFSGFRLCR